NCSSVLDDLFRGGLAIRDLDAEMVDAGASASELGLGHVLAVVDHEREVDVAVSHMPRRMTSRVAGLGLVDAENVLVEFRRLFQIFDLERNMNDAGHGYLLAANPCGEWNADVLVEGSGGMFLVRSSP